MGWGCRPKGCSLGFVPLPNLPIGDRFLLLGLQTQRLLVGFRSSTQPTDRRSVSVIGVADPKVARWVSFLYPTYRSAIGLCYWGCRPKGCSLGFVPLPNLPIGDRFLLLGLKTQRLLVGFRSSAQPTNRRSVSVIGVEDPKVARWVSFLCPTDRSTTDRRSVSIID